MFRNGFSAALFALLAFPASAFAMDTAQLKSALDRFDDGKAAQQMAIDLAGLIERTDKAGLERLSERIIAEDWPVLSAIAGMAENRDEEQFPEIARSMRPCQFANIFIRSIALVIAEGKAQPVIRNGIVMIDGTDLDSNFAQNMWRCEMLRQLPHKTTIGSKCAMTGVCKDDPDL